MTNTMNYYNEIEPYAAEWLRNLMSKKLIPSGTVDTRSIADVQAEDLWEFTQCHFFAGIGGWPLALRLAGWPEDQPVWTGSCPCQPFSLAGKKGGTSDARHLWPEFGRLIRGGKPPVVFGEQVASKAGREWLSGVRADLECMAYEVGGADLCAAGVSAPHIRQRLYWVADSDLDKPSSGRGDNGEVRGLSEAQRESEQRPSLPRGGGSDGRLGDPSSSRRQGDECEVLCGTRGREEGGAASEPSKAQGHWDAYDLIPCSDGKARRVEPGTFPLAHGVPARVGKLRAYGNAIVPQVAACFVRSFMDIRISREA